MGLLFNSRGVVDQSCLVAKQKVFVVERVTVYGEWCERR